MCVYKYTHLCVQCPVHNEIHGREERVKRKRKVLNSEREDWKEKVYGQLKLNEKVGGLVPGWMGGIKQLVCIGHTHTHRKKSYFFFLTLYLVGNNNNDEKKWRENTWAGTQNPRAHHFPFSIRTSIYNWHKRTVTNDGQYNPILESFSRLYLLLAPQCRIYILYAVYLSILIHTHTPFIERDGIHSSLGNCRPIDDLPYLHLSFSRISFKNRSSRSVLTLNTKSRIGEW